ncbi:hypothetical protein [Pararhizobium sp. LjRoot238]|uniref:hypothetical protein n=1 Tax=Pararhizobium sp. LjRoot238 TaxID=3342293 RepID=UPI003ECE2FAC
MNSTKAFLSAVVSGDPSKSFDATKRISDYVGIIVRMVFSMVITVYAGRQVQFSTEELESVLGVARLLTFCFLSLLSLLLFLSFTATTKAVLASIFFVAPPKPDSHWMRRALSFLLFVAASLVSFAIFISIAYQVPLLISHVANINPAITENGR